MGAVSILKIQLTVLDTQWLRRDVVLRGISKAIVTLVAVKIRIAIPIGRVIHRTRHHPQPVRRPVDTDEGGGRRPGYLT
jgi:hypothetical protein